MLAPTLAGGEDALATLTRSYERARYNTAATTPAHAQAALEAFERLTVVPARQHGNGKGEPRSG